MSFVFFKKKIYKKVIMDENIYWYVVKLVIILLYVYKC